MPGAQCLRRSGASTGEQWRDVKIRVLECRRSNVYSDRMAIAPSTGRWKRRPRRLRVMPKPPLSVPQILDWADAHFKRNRRWPTAKSGRVREALDDTWLSVDKSLRVGRRGLDGGSSLARLLSKHRGVRNRKELPPYTLAQILNWADAYHRRNGRWPNEDSGPVDDAPGETWKAVEAALRQGRVASPGGSSIARLLAKQRGVRNCHNLARLTASMILAWADAFRARTGRWPKKNDGAIPEAKGDDWAAIDACLY
jgi:hypothetical protein